MKPQRPIYPQRVLKKKRWADLTHLAHFADLAHFSGFTTQNSELIGGCTEYNVAGRGRAHICWPTEGMPT